MESGMSSRVRGDGKREEKKGAMKAKEFPPPLPWLARTGNSPASRMPWVLKRSYTEDGRLIITGEKTERHEYFEADRSDGRLRLRLVALDVFVGGEPFANEPDEAAAEEREIPGGDHNQIDGGGNGDDDGAVCDGSDAGGGNDPTAAALEDPQSAMASGGSLITDARSGGGGSKCSNSFIFSLAVTAIPPVHT
ncbi:PREDICTED: uncharacterized protein LOC109169810 [Ipomoea nil]|uniref:uncharacterized protein LOC109169810 n=1 Tax=Ipomoea nil TaxID=35883 RepID=UPI0009008C09|nr:PREDICTED: uncharacterized protein LOC109169810 [Ipomoea nil]